MRAIVEEAQRSQGPQTPAPVGLGSTWPRHVARPTRIEIPLHAQQSLSNRVPRRGQRSPRRVSHQPPRSPFSTSSTLVDSLERLVAEEALGMKLVKVTKGREKLARFVDPVPVRPTNDRRERLPGSPLRSPQLLVRVELESDGLGCHARIIYALRRKPGDTSRDLEAVLLIRRGPVASSKISRRGASREVHAPF